MSVRERFDPLAPLIAAHLTLVFPFEDSMSDHVLAKHIRGRVAPEPGFAVTFQGITAHDDEYLFLNVKRGNDELIRLYATLHTGALAAHRSRRHTFLPHVTVGRLRSSELDAALDATAELSDEIVATVDSVSLLLIEKNQVHQLFEVGLP